MKSNYLNTVCSGFILPFLFIFSNLVVAQTIEEILVTAQKRQQSLQGVPLAVTAFTAETLLEDGARGLIDLGDRTPGMVFAPYSAAQPEIAIRGIGTKEDGPAANDSVIISVDDVYIAARSAQVFDIYDLERVEVLRGPQGTLYGKNSIGGSINFVTAKPDENFRARITATGGDYERFDLGGMVSGPIQDNLFGKLAFSHRQRDGYFRNILNGERQGEIDTNSLRGQLRFVEGRFEGIFSADYSTDDNSNPARHPIGDFSGVFNSYGHRNPQLVSRALGDVNDDPFISTSDEPGFFDRSVWGGSARLNWDFDTFTLTSITAYRESDFDWLHDLNGVPQGPGSTACPEFCDPAEGFSSDASNDVAEESEQFTQEIRISSNEAIAGSFNWIGGLFFTKEEIHRDEKVCFGNCNRDFVQRPIDPSPGVDPNMNPPGLIINGSEETNDATAWAAYGEVTWDINDSLSLTGGLRYSEEEKEVTISGARDLGIVDFGIVVSPSFLADPRWSVLAEDDWSNTSYRLALQWDATEDVMLYGSITTGFKSGGFTGTASTPARAMTPFDEETATNFEIGLKSTMFDDTLRLNITGFITDYEDLQVTRFFIPAENPNNTLGEFVTENAASASISGVEVEWLWIPTNVEGLEIGGNFAYLDASFDEYTPSTLDACPAAGAAPDAIVNGNPGCNPDFSGNDLRQSPPITASAYIRYEIPTDMGNFSAKLSGRYQDKAYYDPDNNPITITPSYDVWDARLGWETNEGSWDVSLWAKNFNNEEYFTQVYSTSGGTRAYQNPGDPRTYGITATRRF